jgi:hypothetical protein
LFALEWRCQEATPWLPSRRRAIAGTASFSTAASGTRFTIGKVDETEAQKKKGGVEYLLMRIKQHLLDLPSGCDIVTFLEWDGKPPGVLPNPSKELTLSELREVYFKSQDGKLEETTLAGIRQHFNHLDRILGDKCHIPSLSRAELQRYVDTRSKEWIDPEVYRRKRRANAMQAKPRRKYVRKSAPPKAPETPERAKRHPSAATIKKEIISLRTAWNWARRHLDLPHEFPGGHLDYQKLEEALPFQTQKRLPLAEHWGFEIKQPIPEEEVRKALARVSQASED